jgi:phosphopantothenoylcysteine decarboxylase / phosphopantothenate---cysteine ligase
VRLLITAGPTREYLDDVRYLSNASSGQMGFALAQAAVDAGHRVSLVSGPVHLCPPAGCDYYPVETSREMYEACERLFLGCDGVIGAAAVCDYRPKRRAAGKLSKTGQGLSLELEETADILAALGAKKESRFILGFALESTDRRANALRKLGAKNCDAIVLNTPEAIGSATTSVELISRDGQTVATYAGSKPEVAKSLIAWLTAQIAGQQGR